MSEYLYGSSGDVRELLGNPVEQEVTATLIDLAREKATRLVNSYVEVSYPSQVPFASGNVPLLLDSLTDDLSVYYVKRALHTGVAPISDEVKEEYWEKPIGILEKISKSEIQISELQDKDGDIVSSSRSKYTPIFDVDDTVNHILDSDLENDIGNSRT
uniref:Uncharacterized protein n=1 Tax=viral metagenome TaxID=1070528 RepID=A0A6M3LDP5_9ZZZZ